MKKQKRPNWLDSQEYDREPPQKNKTTSVVVASLVLEGGGGLPASRLHHLIKFLFGNIFGQFLAFAGRINLGWFLNHVYVF
jgi:hypothetical protein